MSWRKSLENHLRQTPPWRGFLVEKKGKNMTPEFFNEIIRPDVCVTFANGGRLVRGETLWTYERDGRSCIALEPEQAVIGAEGDGKGILVWKGDK